MGRDFKGLSAAMKKIADNVQKNADKKKRLAALIIGSELTMETPIDEGRARSNWQASTGTPIDATIPAYAPGKKGSTGAENARAAMSQQQSAINQSKPEEAIYIVNNLPYIKPLNEGHSPQVRPGFVERAVQRGIEAGAKIRITEK